MNERTNERREGGRERQIIKRKKEGKEVGIKKKKQPPAGFKQIKAVLLVFLAEAG